MCLWYDNIESVTMGDFPFLEWLTRHYLEEAEPSDWRRYLQAHGLANYCVVVDTREERRRLVYDIEDSWYKGEHPLTFDQHKQLTNGHKQSLKAYRDDTRPKFGSLETLAKNLDEEKLSDEQNMERIKNFALKVTEASQACSKDFKNVSNDIISSSVDLLKQTGRDAPCGFVVLGLGSIAKGEATPYSDLEYAFLVERDDEYFTSLAMDSYFRLGNLGESPLKTFDIEELNSEGKQLPLATAQRMKAGLRIDGITTNSGNIPTGNGKDNSQSLTLTMDGFMKLYKKSAESPFDGMPGDKSDMLSSTVVIYPNGGTTSQLHSSFENSRKLYEKNEAVVNEDVNKKRFESFKKDLNKYAFLPGFVDFKPPENMDVQVKTDIFRYPTLLASNIKMCLGLDTRCSWDVFDGLKSKGLLSAENHRHIQAVLAISIYMRTSAYLHQGCQMEDVMINPYVTEHTRQFYPIDLNLFVILGCWLIPLKRHITSVMNTVTASRGLDRSVASTFVNRLICCTSTNRIEPKEDNSRDVVLQFLKFKIDSKDDLLMAEVLHFAGRYSQAKTVVCGMAGNSLELQLMKEVLERKCTDRQTTEKYIELCGYVLYHTGDYAIAGEYLQHLVNSRKTQGKFLNLLVIVCKRKTGDYQSAMRRLKSAKVMTKRVGKVKVKPNRVESADSKTNHPDIAVSYNNIGEAYSDLGEYKSALESHNKSLEMMKAIYGAEANHPDIAASYNYIGNAYRGLGEYTSALEFHKKSLEMKKAVYGAEADHPDVAASYNNIGNAYSGLGESVLALEYHNKSLAMKEAVYGAEAKHPDIAVSYNNIGNAYNDLHEYAQALEFHKKSLKMRKAVYGAETNHPDIAGSYNNIGNASNDLHEYAQALEFHKKSLKMRKAVYGAEANHPHIADSYNNIGSAYGGLGDYTSALEYLTKSLEMRKAVYGAEANHPDIDKIQNAIDQLTHVK